MGLAAGYKAWILTIGNEILIGRIVNTNAAWLGRKLTHLGYSVYRGIVVPDEIGEIAWAFQTALTTDVKVVVSTGGLGPTFDDKTAEGLAAALGVELELNKVALDMIRRKYASKGLELTEARVKMAKLPKGASPLPNPVGTAPGIHIEAHGKHIFALPGVPKEMKVIFEAYIEPLLKKIGPPLYFAETIIRVVGVPESAAAPLINEAMRYSPSVYIKSHPKLSETEGPLLEFHITSSASSKKKARQDVENVAAILVKLLRKAGAKIIK